MGRKRKHPHPQPAQVAPAPPPLPAAAASAPAPVPVERRAEPPPGRKRLWRVVGLSAVAVGFLALAYDLRSILNPILLSLFVAYMLSPIVDGLERWHVPRTISILGLYLVMAGTITVVLVFAFPAAFAQAESLFGMVFRGDRFEDVNGDKIWTPGEPLTEDWNGNGKYDTSFLDRGIALGGDWVRRWNEKYPERKIDSETVYTQLSEWAKGHAGQITETSVDVGGTVARTLKSGLSGIWDLISYVVLVPIYIFFFLLGINRLRDSFFEHLPGRYREDILRVLHRIHAALSAFFRGKLVICFAKGVFTFTGLWLVGVKFSLVFGILQALGSLIPFVPLVVGAVPAEVVVFMDVGMAWWPLLATAGIFFLAEVIEGFVLTPLVLGKETGLHPLVLIVSIMIGGELFGFFGVLLSVPLASIVKILFQEFVLPPLEALAAERPEA